MKEPQGLPEPGRSTVAPRVWIDCTGTYLSDLHTGIQRVVRNLVRYGLQAEIFCRPVAFVPPCWYAIDWQPEAEGKDAGRDGRHSPPRSAASGDSRSARWRRKLQKALVPRTLVRWCNNLVRHTVWSRRYGRVPFRPGDVLLLPDMTWGYSTRPAIESLHRGGVKVGLVVHDLIPLTHPQFFLPGAQRQFQAWWHAMAPQADFFVGDSRATRDAARDHVLRHFPQAGFTEDSFSWFPLGEELDEFQAGGDVRPAVREAFAGNAAAPSPYLTVSTIEPRKNHRLLLDAFEQLWAARPQARLCLVGKQGWLCEEFVARVRRHPLLNQRLFWFSDLSDTELDYCYRHARAFLFASFAEGYGLPIVEALERRLAVFASDTAVHREVARDFAWYFDPHRPETLAELLRDFETGRPMGAVRPAQEFRATDWNTSIQELLTTCLRLADRSRQRQLSHQIPRAA